MRFAAKIFALGQRNMVRKSAARKDGALYNVVTINSVEKVPAASKR